MEEPYTNVQNRSKYKFHLKGSIIADPRPPRRGRRTLRRADTAAVVLISTENFITRNHFLKQLE